jgi:hypothetical protein
MPSLSLAYAALADSREVPSAVWTRRILFAAILLTSASVVFAAPAILSFALACASAGAWCRWLEEHSDRAT